MRLRYSAALALACSFFLVGCLDVLESERPIFGASDFKLIPGFAAQRLLPMFPNDTVGKPLQAIANRDGSYTLRQVDDSDGARKTDATIGLIPLRSNAYIVQQCSEKCGYFMAITRDQGLEFRLVDFAGEEKTKRLLAIARETNVPLSGRQIFLPVGKEAVKEFFLDILARPELQKVVVELVDEVKYAKTFDSARRFADSLQRDRANDKSAAVTSQPSHEPKKRTTIFDKERLARAYAAYDRTDYAFAFGEYQQLAQKGYLEAQQQLGHMYEKGFGVVTDAGQAKYWYGKALENAAQRAASDSGAAVSLANMYLSGWGVAKNVTQGAAWARKAAESGNARGQFLLGVLYDKGTGVPQDVALAITWVRRAAEQGNASAQLMMGLAYDGGTGWFPRDQGAAIAWYRKAAAQGHPAAKTMLENMGSSVQGSNNNIESAPSNPFKALACPSQCRIECPTSTLFGNSGRDLCISMCESQCMK